MERRQRVLEYGKRKLATRYCLGFISVSILFKVKDQKNFEEHRVL